MFDIGWSEMLVVAMIAIIVVGPKDLPKALRAVSKVVAKGRALAREFQSGLDDVMRQAELDDIKKSVESVAQGDLESLTFGDDDDKDEADRPDPAKIEEAYKANQAPPHSLMPPVEDDADTAAVADPAPAADAKVGS